jgi:hypothetical protein
MSLPFLGSLVPGIECSAEGPEILLGTILSDNYQRTTGNFP